jgi:hypothetical protein
MSADLSFGSMTYDVFDENWSTIATEVKTILGAGGKTRRRFRVFRGAVYERKTGELLAELLRTSLGPVVVFRAGEPGDNHASQKGEFLIGFRQARGVNGLAVAPFTGIESQDYFDLVASGGGRGQYLLTGEWLVARTYPDNLLVFR